MTRRQTYFDDGFSGEGSERDLTDDRDPEGWRHAAFLDEDLDGAHTHQVVGRDHCIRRVVGAQ